MIEETDYEEFLVPKSSWRQAQRDNWLRLERHVQAHYHSPDMEGLKIVAAAAAAHTVWPKLAPIWLFVMGASGTGKSSIVGSVMEGFPFFNVLSNVTPQTFMSGLQLGGKKQKSLGLLDRLGSQIVFWISDLSSILSMREDDRAKIMSQMREIYDGRISKDFGNGATEKWRGKCTMLAGCTPNIENLWAVGRDLGERFLILRWRHGDEQELALAAAMMTDEGETKAETSHLTRQWAGDLTTLRDFAPMLTPQLLKEHQLPAMADTVASLRRGVSRDRTKGNAISDIGIKEGPGRIMMTLTGIATTNAVLMGRSELIAEDIALSRRVARDSVPRHKATILSILSESNKSAMTAHDVQIQASNRGWGVSVATIRNLLEEFVALEVLRAQEFSGQKFFSSTDWWEERKGLLGW